jgi:hypothetical protein
VGTPFDVTSPRFEYPFPNGESPIDAEHSLSASLPSLSSPFSFSNSSASSSQSLLSVPFSLSPLPPQNTNYSTTHPKLRSSAGRQPPVPPGLAEKRHRWTQGLKMRNGSDVSFDCNGTVASAGVAAGRRRNTGGEEKPSGASCNGT